MASISKRLNKDGSITYRVFIRRKGLKPVVTSFPSLKMATQWVKENEAVYVNSGISPEVDKLRTKRFNEFFRSS